MIDFSTLGNLAGAGIGLIGSAIQGRPKAPSTSAGQKTDWWAMQQTSDAVQRAQQAVENAYNTSRGYMLPYYSAGTGGLSALTAALTPSGGMTPTDMMSGLPPGVGANALNWLTQTPMYQFPLQQGIQALDRSAAARGLLRSGAQQKGITDYAQNYAISNALAPAQQNYQNYLRNIAGLSGAGQTAANTLGGWAMNTGQEMAGLNMQGAQMQNALAQNIAGLQTQGSLYGSANQMYNQNALGSLFGGIGGLVANIPWNQIGNAAGIGSSYGNQAAARNALNTYNTIWG